MERRMVVVQRDCPGRLVPAGTRITIPKDTFVGITQALGGSYTVNVGGNLARVDGTDADALGLEAVEFTFAPSDSDQVSEDNVWEALRSIYDPEIPVNIVDLGLIYACTVSGNRVDITMTLTAPGCGMGPVLAQDVQNKLISLEPIDEANVELVWDPPWNQGMMTEAAKLQLGLL